MRAIKLYHRLQAVLRLSVHRRFDPEGAPQGLRQALVRAAFWDQEPVLGQAYDFAELQGALVEAQTTVSRIFAALCPAEAGRGAGPPAD